MKSKIWLIIKVLFMILSLGSSIYLTYKLNELNMIPMKYFVLIITGIIIINIINILFLVFKKIILNIIGIILSIAVVIISCLAIKHVSNITDFINKSFNNNKEEITVYNVVVLFSSNYEKIEDLNKKSLGYDTFDENKNDCLTIIDSKVKVDAKVYEDADTLYNDLLDKKIDSILITEGMIQLLEEEHRDIYDNIKTIYSFDIKKEINNINEDIKSLDTVNILISGSDSRSGKILSKTRSDVNMIMTIDPKNKKILLTSIPRDYYVQLHGTNGYKDKLTHSGIYGIQMTKNTLEDLFDIKIDYTIKVGFQSVIQLVDTLGGIDIDSDASFKSHCGDGGAIKTDVVKGINHFNGGQALSYARERYAYKTGDNHRVQNQQQVLEAIINKITIDKSLLKRYDKILDSLKETYRTDIPSSYIRLLVNNELDNMSGWTIERQQVSGSGSMDRTYSMPSVKLWVMVPDMSSVKKCTDNILKYFEE